MDKFICRSCETTFPSHEDAKPNECFPIRMAGDTCPVCRGRISVNPRYERRQRLAPAGVPRYIRAYDNGGETLDRYTVVFTGRYKGKSSCLYLAMSDMPYHPQGFGQHGESDAMIDGQGYSHLGKRIAFSDLPPDCQSLVMSDYTELWEC